MANEEHVGKIEEGAEAWNLWRIDNPDIDPDLSGANLSKANLYGANLNGVDLSGADLGGANLSEAVIYKANLSGANLSGADLSGANLNLANLINAVFRKATLTGASLWQIQRDGWVIEGVICEQFYDDKLGKHKVPKGRDFERGEFERFFTSLPTFEYIFENGMHPLDPFFMNQVAEEISRQNPEYELEVDSIKVKGDKPSIKFTV
ncbi:MAG: pentapeptide repeat-containing protein, partial [Nitrospinae bacterium]|nr:pentapeptide repeat-containing protein [Nitrospinota bacterium]